MVIFSHRGVGFGNKENSIESLSNVVKKGVSVEVDLRLMRNNIILSHDEEGTGEYENFGGLLKLMEESPAIYFALHLKENSKVLFKEISGYLKALKNYFFFVTDFKQEDFIRYLFGVVGQDRLALYVRRKKVDTELAGKVDYFWMDETEENVYKDLDYFQGFNKKIICCSPELYIARATKERIINFRDMVKNRIFGICTDLIAGENYEKV